jgi:hypothetical protein
MLAETPIAIIRRSHEAIPKSEPFSDTTRSQTLAHLEINQDAFVKHFGAFTLARSPWRAHFGAFGEYTANRAICLVLRHDFISLLPQALEILH